MASPKSGRIAAGIFDDSPEPANQKAGVRKAYPMTLDGIDQAGFAPRNHARVRRSRMMAQLITSVALMLSIAVAATARCRA